MTQTLCKAVSDAQLAAFTAARQTAGLTEAEAKDAAFRLFCELWNVPWPRTAQHGGPRYAAGERKCPKCKDGLISDGRGEWYDCDRCGGSGAIPTDEEDSER